MSTPSFDYTYKPQLLQRDMWLATLGNVASKPPAFASQTECSQELVTFSHWPFLYSKVAIVPNCPCITVSKISQLMAMCAEFWPLQKGLFVGAAVTQASLVDYLLETASQLEKKTNGNKELAEGGTAKVYTALAHHLQRIAGNPVCLLAMQYSKRLLNFLKPIALLLALATPELYLVRHMPDGCAIHVQWSELSAFHGITATHIYMCIMHAHDASAHNCVDLALVVAVHCDALPLLLSSKACQFLDSC